MPQVGTVNVNVTFVRSPSTDVTRHEVRLRTIGGEWPDLVHNTSDPDTASHTFMDVPQWDTNVAVSAEVRAVDAGGHFSIPAGVILTIPAGDPPPAPPSDVAAAIV